MTDVKSYLVINAIPYAEKAGQVMNYLSQIMPIFAANGGRPVGRYRTVDQLIGDGGPTQMAVFEFASDTTVKDMLAGEDFKSLSDLRDEIFERLDLMLCAPL